MAEFRENMMRDSHNLFVGLNEFLNVNAMLVDRFWAKSGDEGLYVMRSIITSFVRVQ
jgi:hypothetical protein